MVAEPTAKIFFFYCMDSVWCSVFYRLFLGKMLCIRMEQINISIFRVVQTQSNGSKKANTNCLLSKLRWNKHWPGWQRNALNRTRAEK